MGIGQGYHERPVPLVAVRGWYSMVYKKRGFIFARKKMETNFISELLNFGLFWKVENL